MTESWKEFRHRTGREYLLALMEQHKWNVSAAARACGVNRTDFYKVLAKFAVRKAPEVRASLMTPEFRRFLGVGSQQVGS